MRQQIKILLVFTFLALGLLLGSSVMVDNAEASIIFQNGTGGDDAMLSPEIGTGSDLEVSESFTVSGNATLQSAVVDLATVQGLYDVPAELTWEIGTTPFGSDVSSGQAGLDSTLIALYESSPNGVYEQDYQSSFALGGSLSAGTYYFSVVSVSTSGQYCGGSAVYWDNSYGIYPSSSSASYYLGPNNEPSDSQFFELIGVVPEPSQFACCAGVLALVSVGLRGFRNRHNRM